MLVTMGTTKQFEIPESLSALRAVSLFCSSGIGDLGIHANGIRTVAACELLPERMELFKHNNPEAKCFCGDVWKLKEEIVSYYKSTYDDNPFLLLATPPCQGMSSNGMGTMLRNFKKGIRPKFDERNRLIIPAIEIIKELRPEWVVLENVPNMTNTLILDNNDNLVNIIEYVFRELAPEYKGAYQVMDVAEYGVPQHRKRLITILSRNPRAHELIESGASIHPMPTHDKTGSLLTSKILTLRDVISHLPKISSEKGKNVDDENPLHKVPLLDEKKLIWVRNTPEGQTALNNQCINPECRYQGNRTHGTSRDAEGVNKSNMDTPLYCEKCGSLLPRPYTEDKTTGKLRIMRAFTSAYKRMSWDEPCSTLTQNFQYACSDNKLHPDQDRVLSLYEGLIIQTIARYPYSFEIGGRLVNDGLIRDTIGESVPPLLIDSIIRNILTIAKQN